MHPFRFLHAADLHLDSPFRGMTDLPPRVRERVKESTFHALQQLVRVAIRERVDFVVISGDVYDLADRSLRAQIRFQKSMELLAANDIPVYIIHGNHDPEDGRAARLSWPAAVHFFSSERVETIAVEKPGRGLLAHVHGISYRTPAVADNLALQFKAADSAVFQIGLLHTNVDGDPAHDNYAPCSKQDLLQSGMNYWALGHVHNRRELHDMPAIVYPGNIQGRSVRECGAKGCYIVDVNEAGESKLTFHSLDSVRWFHQAVSIQGLQTEQDVRDVLEQHMGQALAEADGRSCIVRFVLEGRGAVHSLLQKGKALQELMTELREGELERVSLLDRGGDTLGKEMAYRGNLGEEMLSTEDSGRQTSPYPRLSAADQPSFVWIESIEDRTGQELDKQLLLEQQSFLGELLRLSRTLTHDEQAVRALCEEALAALRSHAQTAKLLDAASSSPEQLQQWLLAAEELAIDALVDGGGWNG